MKLINTCTAEVLEVEDDQALHWLSSCTPWTAEDKSLLLRLNRADDANERMHVNLKHCYGIKKLSYVFDFHDGKPYSIYAPNGFMKTSFAKTLKDVQDEEESCDEVYSDRVTERDVSCKDGKSINPDSVYVIPPYKEGYNAEGSTILLVNSDLRKEYESKVERIEQDLASIEKALNAHFGKKGSLNEVKSVFNVEDSDLYEFLSSAIDNAVSEEFYGNLPYDVVFNDKVEKFLQSAGARKEIEDFLNRYNTLVDESPILSRKFSHRSASTISNSLETSGYFQASHSLNISRDKESVKVSSKDEFEKIIEEERSRILLDEELEKNFQKLDKGLDANAQLRKFREYLLDHKEILPELSNFQDLKKKVWRGYFSKERSIFEAYSSNFKQSKTELKTIIESATKEKTKWEKVVDIFNERFHVPFKLKVENQNGVILKSEEPVISFEFSDGAKSVDIDRTKLLRVLSLGEKRALYILNILFDINARREADVNTIFVVDDIADSFDYKNKYAIIEYFKELSETKDFNFIFLTHNFDFHRTICSRMNIPAEKGLFAVKDSERISLQQDHYQGNPFISWKDNLERSDFAIIACIPFVRNLIEFTAGFSEDYRVLTSLLHIQDESDKISIKDLADLYSEVLQKKVSLKGQERSVLQVIMQAADSIYGESSVSISLEEKIVLSIAIRLVAEKFMIQKIDDKAFLKTITKNQTMQLCSRYIKDNPDNSDIHSLLTQVNLMTPENIHLNSFMYEPILDMSSQHLCDLYGKIKAL